MTQDIVLQTETLSEAEFLEQAEAASRSVAVFDCDGTLWAGDAGVGFMRWSMDSGLLSREATEWMDERYRGYQAGQVLELAICGEMVQVYRGLRERELRQAVHTFYTSVIRPHIFPAMAELCSRLRRNGVTLWAVSSTNTWLIEDAMQDFGIPAERVLAARVRVVDGIATSELEDVPTDEGKAASLVRSGVERPDAVFGNSIHDAAMLAMARRPFAVNPTAALREHAAAEGWAVFQPQMP